MTASSTTTIVSLPQTLEWQVGIADQLVAAGVTVAAYVPDWRLNGILVRLGEQGVTMRSLTREEECIGYACGQRIVGVKVVVLLQSSGIGNALNAMGTLAIPYRLGIPLIVSMRGTLGEKNPSQVPIGRGTAPILATLGIQSFSLRNPDQVPALVNGVLDLAFSAGEVSALIIEPELGGGRA